MASVLDFHLLGDGVVDMLGKPVYVGCLIKPLFKGEPPETLLDVYELERHRGIMNVETYELPYIPGVDSASNVFSFDQIERILEPPYAREAAQVAKFWQRTRVYLDIYLALAPEKQLLQASKLIGVEQPKCGFLSNQLAAVQGTFLQTLHTLRSP